MLKKIVLVFAAVALAKAQIPSLGWCPNYVPMANFDMNRFLGVWYEAERYFQLSEVVSRCVVANYTRGADNKVRVSNEVTNRITGVKRVLEGEIKPAASKSEEGQLFVKYTTVPLAPETHYSVLETDYRNYAVLWSCSGIGPVNAQNAWLMTRNRYPAENVLQEAYGVLDKYGIWRRLFVKTDQSECAYDKQPVTAAPAAAPAPEATAAPVKEEVAEPAAAERKVGEVIYQRSTGVLEEAATVDETRKEEAAILLPEAPAAVASPIVDEPVEKVGAADPEVAKVPAAEEKPIVDDIKPQEAEFKPIAPETIPEVILKVAESAKESAAEPAAPIAEELESSVNPAGAESQTVEVAVPAESKPEQTDAVLPIVGESAEESKVVEAGAEPVEELKLAEEPKPLETGAAPTVAEDSKPVEQLPAVKSAVSEVEKPLEEPEAPAAAVLPKTAAKKSGEIVVPVETAAVDPIKVDEILAAQEAPADSVLLKTLEIPAAENSESVVPESAEASKVPEEGELSRDSFKASPEVIPEPLVPETPAVKAVEVAAPEEPKLEAIAEAPKTPEAKP